MTVAYVHRDRQGAIAGVYDTPQPGISTELVAADDPAVLLFRASTVTALQAKIALAGAGMLAGVEAWVALQSAEVQLRWERATQFDRNSQFIVDAVAGLGLTAAEMDALFVAASQIP